LATSVGAADLVTTYQQAEPDLGDGVKIGILTCDVGGGVGYVLGSAKSVDCVFSPTSGSETQDRYAGAIRKLGVDVGFTTRGRIVWAVFAPTTGYHRGSLGGLTRAHQPKRRLSPVLVQTSSSAAPVARCSCRR
jgi:hypothetical protein